MKPTVFLSALAATATAATVAAATTSNMAVTDLRVIVADSEQNALTKCHAIDSNYVSVGVDWTMTSKLAPSTRFVQLCKQRQNVNDAKFTGDVVQRIRVTDGACPVSASPSATWTSVYSPRAGVSVCMLKTSAQRAKQLGEYLVDVDATTAQFYNDAVQGWTMLRDVSVQDAQKPGDVKTDSGVFLSVRRPMAPITAVTVVPAASTGDVCVDASDDGLVKTTDAGAAAVLCVARAAGASMLVDVSIVAAASECEKSKNALATETKKTTFTPALSLCLSYGKFDNTTAFVSELRLDRLRPSKELKSNATAVAEETERFITAVQKSGFELVKSATPLETVKSKTTPMLFMRRFQPVKSFEASSSDTAAAPKPPLKARVNANGTLSFKVLQLADLHYTGNSSYSCLEAPSPGCTEALMTKFVGDLLDTEKPDFVVLTGDNVQTYSAELRQPAMDAVVAQLEQRSMPYAMVFGNHDDENNYLREDVVKAAMTKPHSYTQRGPMQVDGVGNYLLNVQAPSDGTWGTAGADVFRMYFLDSHAYPNTTAYPMVESFYDWIKPTQVQYFQQMASSVKQPVPAAVMFFHMPIPEYQTAPSGNTTLMEGLRREASSPASVNSHLFSALVDQQEVKATFIGHDHLNDFCYKREGIQLCYGGGGGFGLAYGNKTVARRARVIEWSIDSNNQRQIKTWKRLHTDLAATADMEMLYVQPKESVSSGKDDSSSLTWLWIVIAVAVVLVVVGVVVWKMRSREAATARESMMLPTVGHEKIVTPNVQ